jgi:hypothetical protein
MLGKTNNFFLSLYKKKTFLFVFFFSLFGLYPLICSAQWLENLRRGIGEYVLFLIVRLAVNIAVFFVGLAGSLLNWVLSPDFISLSYTNPANNPIIETGLNVTRGFVNMLLVLILVFIAVGTILRLAGYETRKLLVTFIIVALLVNFTTVIAGMIVDASNIIMNFFVQDLNADTFGRNMGVKVAEISSGFNDSTSAADSWQFITQLAVMVPFLWILTFILLVFTFIFIFRYLAIWILVILSPLAFACYILPITKKYFDQWWQQLINWALIGITCGFFLYLGLLLVTYVPTEISRPETEGGDIFDSILPFFVSLGFLVLGVIFGFKSSAVGASTVLSLAKTKGKRAVTKGSGWVGRKIGRGVKQQVERLPVKRAAAGITKAVERVPMARWFLPETFRKYAETRPAIEAEQKRVSAYSSREIAHRIRTKTDIGVRAAGGMVELVKRGDMQDLVNAYKKRFYGRKAKDTPDEELFKNKKFLKEMDPALHVLFQSGYQSSFLRSDPRIARVVAGKEWAGNYKNKTPEQAVEQAASEARRTHINQWEREVLEDKDVMDNLLGRGREVFESIDTQVKRGQPTAQKTINEMFSKYADKAAPKLGIDLSKPINEKDHETLWSAYNEYYKKTHKGQEGYFKALRDDPRFAARGWKPAEYVSPSQRQATTKAPPTAPTVGAATMGTQAPKGTRATGPTPKGTRTTGPEPKGTRSTGGKPPKGTKI